MSNFLAPKDSSSSSKSAATSSTNAGAKDISNNSRSRPWVEKWRPEKVEDVSHQDEVVRTLKVSIQAGNLPHLLFHGSPGTGKTTTILAVARALYGPELYKSRILELNASDERGISVIREKVKSFAQGSVGNQRTPGYPCPKFKLIILDEADTMTADAQSALRRVMEAYSRVTRFCLICNYVTRVIEPLASRCAKFRFRPLPVHSMIERITFIGNQEKVNLAPGALDTILSASGGDMRKAVTFLQTSHQLACSSSNITDMTSTSKNAMVTSEMVVDVAGQVPVTVMDELWKKMTGTAFEGMQHAVDKIIAEGYPMSAILSQLHDDTLKKSTISDVNKSLICEKLACADLALADGASEALQLLDVAAYMMRRLKGQTNLVDRLVAAH